MKPAVTETLATMVPLVVMDLLAPRETVVRLVTLVPPAPLVLLDPPAPSDPLARLVIAERLVPLVLLALQVPLDPVVLLAPLVPEAIRVRLVRLEKEA